MFRLARCLARIAVCSICVALLMLAVASLAQAGAGPRNVLVVKNLRSSVSKDIADYYVNARGIPYQNICSINCSTDEVVSKAECENNIITPVRNFLANSPVADHIDYIVLTKGIPLAAQYGYTTGPASVTSVMTCLDDPTITTALENPYGPLLPEPMECAFSHQIEMFGGLHMYLVTRLDGYTVQDVHSMIDRAKASSPTGPILLDQKYLSGPGPDKPFNDRMAAANALLTARGVPTIFDSTSAFLANKSNLMGYFSFGSNDSSYTLAAYRSNTFAPGSIADTMVSSSARTFNPTTGGQSLIADLVAQGACGVSGFTSEPYTGFGTYPDVLFDRYTKGYNLAESFYMAAPMLYWKSTVVGDPLMAPYATAPVVTLKLPAMPLTGAVTVQATATDAEGIAKVDFYYDGDLISTDVEAPFSAVIDTTMYPVGQHTVQAIATDAGPVSTEGSASATVDVINAVSALRTIADAYPSADGQAVRTQPKVVTAGTAAMGGGEFYIEESNRASGIKVASSVAVEEGDVVTVAGILATTDGERNIAAADVQVQATGVVPAPLAIVNAFVGGGAIGPYTKGVTGGIGIRNIGLLVRVYGKVIYTGGAQEPFFQIDDGSRVKRGPKGVGLKIACRDLVKPNLGAIVSVTGMSSCEDTPTGIMPVVKPRRQSDIVVVN